MFNIHCIADSSGVCSVKIRTDDSTALNIKIRHLDTVNPVLEELRIALLIISTMFYLLDQSCEACHGLTCLNETASVSAPTWLLHVYICIDKKPPQVLEPSPLYIGN
jgi:hypothetical protein